MADVPPDSCRLISIVIPVFDEEAVAELLFQRLVGLGESLAPDRLEFVLVDDGSTDGTPELLAALPARDARFRVITLSRNFGHQAALTAGLDHARGDAVVFMDADMQDPPEVVVEMVAKWKAGADVVYGRRRERPADTFFKRLSASIFYWILDRVGKVGIPKNVGDFRLLGRQAADALRELGERHRLMRGLSAWIGFRQTCVEYDRPARAAGETKYTLGRMILLALDAVFSFSWVPLRLASLAGLAVVFISSLFVFVNVLLRLFTDVVVPGWTSIVALICFVGGMNLLMLGILGEYVGRIFEEVKRRPLYLVRSVTGPGPPDAANEP